MITECTSWTQTNSILSLALLLSFCDPYNHQLQLCELDFPSHVFRRTQACYLKCHSPIGLLCYGMVLSWILNLGLSSWFVSSDSTTAELRVSLHLCEAWKLKLIETKSTKVSLKGPTFQLLATLCSFTVHIWHSSMHDVHIFGSIVKSDIAGSKRSEPPCLLLW